MSCWRSVRARLRKWLRLSWRERLWFVEAWIRLLVWYGIMALLPFSWIRRHLERGVNQRKTEASDVPDEVCRMLRSFDRAARHHLFPLTCLRRTMALNGMLRFRGFRPLVRFGVQRSDQGWGAHAWLELNGQPLTASDADPSYLPLERPGRGGGG